jgi:hypothetical protein
MRSWGAHTRCLLAYLFRSLRQWLGQLRHPVRCLQALLSLWKRLFGHGKGSGPSITHEAKAIHAPEPTRVTICASRAPESAFVPGAATLTVSSSIGQHSANASTSTLSDHDHTMTPHGFRNLRASYHDILRRSSPSPSHGSHRNISTPNLPHLRQPRSTAAFTDRRPASRVSGRPISLNRSSAALSLVSIILLQSLLIGSDETRQHSDNGSPYVHAVTQSPGAGYSEIAVGNVSIESHDRLSTTLNETDSRGRYASSPEPEYQISSPDAEIRASGDTAVEFAVVRLPIAISRTSTPHRVSKVPNDHIARPAGILRAPCRGCTIDSLRPDNIYPVSTTWVSYARYSENPQMCVLSQERLVVQKLT